MSKRRSLTFSGSSTHHLGLATRAERLAEIPSDRGQRWFAPKRQPQVFHYEQVYAMEPRELFVGTSPWGVRGLTSKARLESLLPSRTHSPVAQVSCAVIAVASLVLVAVVGRNLIAVYMSTRASSKAQDEAYVAPEKLPASRKNSFVALLDFVGRRGSSSSADGDGTIIAPTSASPTTTRKRTQAQRTATVSEEMLAGPSSAPMRGVPQRSNTPLSWFFSQHEASATVDGDNDAEEDSATPMAAKGKWQWRTASPLLSPLALAFPASSSSNDGGELGATPSEPLRSPGYFHRHLSASDAFGPDIRISVEGEPAQPTASTPVTASSASFPSSSRRSLGESSSSSSSTRTSESDDGARGEDDSGVALFESPSGGSSKDVDVALPSPSMSTVAAMDATRTALSLHLAMQGRNLSDSGRSDSSGSSASTTWSEPVTPRSGCASPPVLGINMGMGAVGTASAFPGFMAAAQQHHLDRFAVSSQPQKDASAMSRFVNLPTLQLPGGQRGAAEGLALALDLGIEDNDGTSSKPFSTSFLADGELHSSPTAETPRSRWA